MYQPLQNQTDQTNAGRCYSPPDSESHPHHVFRGGNTQSKLCHPIRFANLQILSTACSGVLRRTLSVLNSLLLRPGNEGGMLATNGHLQDGAVLQLLRLAELLGLQLICIIIRPCPNTAKPKSGFPIHRKVL